MPKHPRARALLAFATTVALGLLSRAPFVSAHWIRAYVGDVLYAVAAFFAARACFAGAARRFVLLGAFVYCMTIEASQAWMNPTLVAARQTAFGSLILGRAFSWSDVVCYTLGVSLAGLVDASMPRCP